jgi:hypothetical protein
MSPIDQRNRLDDDVFSYRATKDGVVHISWHNKLVKTLKGRQAQQFIAKIADLEGKQAQLLMARATGNFKHGNERTAADHNQAAGDAGSEAETP